MVQNPNEWRNNWWLEDWNTARHVACIWNVPCDVLASLKIGHPPLQFISSVCFLKANVSSFLLLSFHEHASNLWVSFPMGRTLTWRLLLPSKKRMSDCDKIILFSLMVNWASGHDGNVSGSNERDRKPISISIMATMRTCMGPSRSNGERTVTVRQTSHPCTTASERAKIMAPNHVQWYYIHSEHTPLPLHYLRLDPNRTSNNLLHWNLEYFLPRKLSLLVLLPKVYDVLYR